MENQNHESMYDSWVFLCSQADYLKLSSLNSTELYRKADTVYNWISSAYHEAHRYYHTLIHIDSCLNELGGWLGAPIPTGSRLPVPAESFALPLAIWLHDAVYDTKASNNEEQSKKLCDNICGVLGLPVNIAKHAGELILQTKNHCIEDPNLWGAFAMHDIDLSILGQTPEIFDKYEENIRKEYEWVPMESYKVARRTILEKFSKKPHIYLTDHFSAKYEKQAQENIVRSLAKL